MGHQGKYYFLYYLISGHAYFISLLVIKKFYTTLPPLILSYLLLIAYPSLNSSSYLYIAAPSIKNFHSFLNSPLFKQKPEQGVEVDVRGLRAVPVDGVPAV